MVEHATRRSHQDVHTYGGSRVGMGGMGMSGLVDYYQWYGVRERVGGEGWYVAVYGMEQYVYIITV